MSETTVEVPGIELLNTADRVYVETLPEGDLRGELATQVRLRRIAEGQCQAHEAELDRVLEQQNGG